MLAHTFYIIRQRLNGSIGRRTGANGELPWQQQLSTPLLVCARYIKGMVCPTTETPAKQGSSSASTFGCLLQVNSPESDCRNALQKGLQYSWGD